MLEIESGKMQNEKVLQRGSRNKTEQLEKGMGKKIKNETFAEDERNIEKKSKLR